MTQICITMRSGNRIIQTIDLNPAERERLISDVQAHTMRFLRVQDAFFVRDDVVSVDVGEEERLEGRESSGHVYRFAVDETAEMEAGKL